MPILPNAVIKQVSSEITKKKLLLVEGKDEIEFFKALLKNNSSLSRIKDDIQIVEIGGVDKFRHEIPALKNRTGFEQVEAIAIIRDSDGSQESAFMSICSILSNNSLPRPTTQLKYTTNQIRVGIFIMPGNEEGTMLEDLCLKTQESHPIMSLTNRHIEEIENNQSVETPKNLSKAKTLVFLASMPSIVNNLGLGAQRGYWNLEHESLNTLVNFLEGL
ncbi:DUF3226 domain-containing protein [Exiguobacterium sp. s21]|uniref:DUF3226 domain-containing protein n=1 Tax=Exiguobacterium sp. s21 TaxID=2751244 RepID=UPI001BE9E814|nr:DUF3226 domain-containing protein [Exiguobacterium sp. s21]